MVEAHLQEPRAAQGSVWKLRRVRAKRLGETAVAYAVWRSIQREVIGRESADERLTARECRLLIARLLAIAGPGDALPREARGR